MRRQQAPAHCVQSRAVRPQGAPRCSARVHRGTTKPRTWPAPVQLPGAGCPIATGASQCHTDRHKACVQVCWGGAQKHRLGAGVCALHAGVLLGVTTAQGRRPSAKGAAALDHRPKATAQGPRNQHALSACWPFPKHTHHMYATAHHTTCSTTGASARHTACCCKKSVRLVPGRTQGGPPSCSTQHRPACRPSTELLPGRRHRCLSYHTNQHKGPQQVQGVQSSGLCSKHTTAALKCCITCAMAAGTRDKTTPKQATHEQASLQLHSPTWG
jgi:hypothetical protein